MARGAGGGDRYDRGGRRARRRLPRRRRRARPRDGRPLRLAARSDAVNELLEVREEVAVALGSGGPVVALETTLVAHGFPPGEGVAVGLESERRVRDGGAVPATIGVLDGRVVVGLGEDE